MTWSRGYLAGTAPAATVLAIILVGLGVWRGAIGDGASAGPLLVIGGLTAIQAVIGWVIRRRHEDPWEPL